MYEMTGFQLVHSVSCKTVVLFILNHKHDVKTATIRNYKEIAIAFMYIMNYC